MPQRRPGLWLWDPLTATPTTSPAPAGADGEPILHALAAELAVHERLGRFAAALPDTRARVSEAALPLFAAALYEHLGRRLVVALPTTPTRATRPRRPPGTSAPTRRAPAEPRRPVGVGPRAAACTSSASGRARSTCSAAAGSSSRRRSHWPRARRPSARVPSRSRSGSATSPGSTALPRLFALAGYERVEQAEERGQFAVRGGIVDVFPSTGREPLRIELFGDEIESVRAFSPFTQRALHAVREALVYPAAERRPDFGEPTPPGRRERSSPRKAPTISCRCSTRRRTSSGRPTRC